MDQLAELKTLEKIVRCEPISFPASRGHSLNISMFIDRVIDRSKDIYEKHLRKKLSLNQQGRLLVPSGLATHNLTLVILRVHLSYAFDDVRLIDEEGISGSIPDIACKGQRSTLIFTGPSYRQKEHVSDNLSGYALPSNQFTLIEVKSGGMNGAKEQLRNYEYSLGVSCNKLVYMLERRRGLQLVF